MVERAYAKLNLTLDVLGKKPDGYHELRMVMQSVEFGDDVEVELTDGGFFIDPGQSYLPANERNLAYRAATLFLSGTDMGARIRVTKRIPVCAGLGGGSSDAAAVLRALNKLTGVQKTPEELRALALQLGSDVPFCVEGGTCLAEGRGELLTPAPAMPDCDVLICKPSFSIPTPELFSRIDRRRIRMRPNTAGLLDALERHDIKSVCRHMYNVFEDVLTRRQDEIFALKGELLDRGALGAVMTGTGSAVFGLFDDEAAANAAYGAMCARYSECWLTRPVGKTAV